MRLQAFGISVETPSGWSARLWDRLESDPQVTTSPTLHAATFPLPREDGSFAQTAMASMELGDILVVLVEAGGPEVAGEGQYANTRWPRSVAISDLSERAAPAPIPGVVGRQWFITVSGVLSSSMLQPRAALRRRPRSSTFGTS